MQSKELILLRTHYIPNDNENSTTSFLKNNYSNAVSQKDARREVYLFFGENRDHVSEQHSKNARRSKITGI